MNPNKTLYLCDVHINCKIRRRYKFSHVIRVKRTYKQNPFSCFTTITAGHFSQNSICNYILEKQAHITQYYVYTEMKSNNKRAQSFSRFASVNIRNKSFVVISETFTCFLSPKLMSFTMYVNIVLRLLLFSIHCLLFCFYWCWIN